MIASLFDEKWPNSPVRLYTERPIANAMKRAA